MMDRWFSGLSPEDKKVRRDLLKASKVFARLAAEQVAKERIKPKPSDFDSPSWAYKEAYRQGYEEALTKALAILNIEDA